MSKAAKTPTSKLRLSPMAPGQRYGRLVAIEFINRPYGTGPAKWRFICDCGHEHIAFDNHVRRAMTLSCGCLQREAGVIIGCVGPASHGKSYAPEYRIWQAMKTRCCNANHKHYRHYGGRGISVCERWLNSFENFYTDMGPRPDGKTLDRYPNKDGNYEPNNCRWATWSEQNLNRRKSHS